MSVAVYVTLGNISCNLCRNKIARQVAREIAWCNIALKLIALNLYALFSHVHVKKKSLHNQSERRTAIFTGGRITNQ